MPITTYRNNKNTFISDKDMNESLPKYWYVEKREVKKRFTKPYYLYQLLYDYWGNGLGNSIEYQIINFWIDENDSSLKTWVSKEVIMAFLMGLLNKEE